MLALMQGKRGLIMGVANDHSIAWGIARTLAAHGATLALTYQGDALGRRVRPLALSLGSELVLPCDVDNIASVDAVFATLAEKWGALDFLVHAIAFSDKNELKGRYADTTRENFVRTMMISCFSFTELAKRAAALMPQRRRHGDPDLQRRPARHAQLQRDGGRQGGAGGLGALSRGRFRPFRHPGQRHLGRPDPHAGGRRHIGCARHVQLPAAPFAAAPRGDARRDRRRRALSSVRPIERGDRRHPFRGFRLQHHHHAESRSCWRAPGSSTAVASGFRPERFRISSGARQSSPRSKVSTSLFWTGACRAECAARR